MKKRGRFYLAGLAVLIFSFTLLATSAFAQFDYSGSLNLTGSGADGTLVGNPTNGGWGDSSLSPLTTLSWNVSWDGSGLVHYEYTFSHPSHDTSFFILETSSNFSGSDITNLSITSPYATGDISDFYEIGTFSPDPVDNFPYSNIPDSITGIKFNLDSIEPNEGINTFTIAFDSARLPQWGDFYARCGVRPAHDPGQGGDPNSFNYAYNTGFVSGEPNYPEPLQVAAGDGSVASHLLVPDTVVPEPVSSTLFIVGGAFFAGRRYFRRKK